MMQAEADRQQRQQEEEGQARAAERHAKARSFCSWGSGCARCVPAEIGMSGHCVPALKAASWAVL